MTDPLPLLVEPAQLESHLADTDVQVIDLSPGELFAQHHVPGSVHLPYAELIASRPPVSGLLPARDQLERMLSAAGIGPATHVVALDAEGGGAAGRLLWTLEAHGHRAVSMLNGGLHAWVNEGFPTESGVPAAASTGTLTLPAPQGHIAEAEYIMAHLGEPGLVALDARSAEEYDGTAVRAARSGHIPGAVHYEWTRGMDRANNLRLRPLDELRTELDALGVTPDREIVTYCHTHHRSAFSYAMLRILGFERVLGYPGSWSDWGNRRDTPVE